MRRTEPAAAGATSAAATGIVKEGFALAGMRRGRTRSRAPRALVAATALVAALVLLPILSVASSLLSPRTDVMAHLASTILPDLLTNTGILVLVVGLGTVSIGVVSAWLVTQCRFPFSRAFVWLLLLPLAIPGYIIGYAYADFLAYAGPLQTSLRELFGWATPRDYWFPNVYNVWGVSAMLTFVLYPYVYLLARAAFLEQTANAFDASRALGHGPWSAFFRVALPLARPAIAAGVALALMEALADFGTMQYYGVRTFTTAIYRTWFGMGDQTAAAQLATGLLVFVLVLIALELHARGAQRYTQVGRGARKAPAFRLRGWRAALAVVACALPVIAGFVAPVLILVRLHLIGGDPFMSERFWRYAANSLTLAAMAAVLLVGVAILLAYATRLSQARSLRALVRVSTIGYAVPGTVVAVGVLAPLGAFDNAVDGFFRETFGISTGLILSGTVVAVLFAYLVRFLAIAYGSVESGFLKISRTMDDAARMLGETPGGVVARVHGPLLRGSLVTAALIVFVDVLKELPATLIVRPFNFDTLAVRVYQLASDERLAQAATGALAIVAVGILPVLLLMRVMARGESAR
ncbi:ABC transporter permease [Salinarimonas rosea]|uniref:ABC transporter permease n=1 Tax=Salinarimonas rosea TaxID=552063 RepID=UPI000409F3A2|nr:iron ABC transporter permease [Salinarimonas rosea]